MSSEKEKMYEIMGELIYAIAKADGIVQEEEISKLNEILEGHPWASEIRWSFNYEKNRGASVEEVYKKVIDYCKNNGASAEYAEFLDVMKQVAKASEGIDSEEEQVINSFTQDLMERFNTDISEMYGE
ncbi:MAG: tellurite resistance protein [Flammeovirgaceae bacterium]|jgi:tellurite resistance protein